MSFCTAAEISPRVPDRPLEPRFCARSVAFKPNAANSLLITAVGFCMWLIASARFSAACCAPVPCWVIDARSPRISLKLMCAALALGRIADIAPAKSWKFVLPWLVAATSCEVTSAALPTFPL